MDLTEQKLNKFLNASDSENQDIYELMSQKLSVFVVNHIGGDTPSEEVIEMAGQLTEKINEILDMKVDDLPYKQKVNVFMKFLKGMKFTKEVIKNLEMVTNNQKGLDIIEKSLLDTQTKYQGKNKELFEKLFEYFYILKENKEKYKNNLMFFIEHIAALFSELDEDCVKLLETQYVDIIHTM